MSRHLKTRIINRLDGIVDHYVQLPPNSAPRARGVRYFVPVALYKAYWGAMNSVKEGNRYQKHIVVRRMPYAKGLLQLYTYHFPKTWSAACVANRELIKLAQRMAHAFEHSYTPEALEWRIRFFNHYFTVVKGGAKPEPGLKPYSRFYQYTYVAIYRELQSARLQEQQPDEDVTFEPVHFRSFAHSPLRAFVHSPLRSAARRAYLSPSLDESFILKPLAPFSG